GRRRHSCPTCPPHPPCLCSSDCLRVDCITSNIHDDMTLGTTFTAYGGFDSSQTMGHPIGGLVEHDGGTSTSPAVPANMGNGTWQIDFTAAASTSATDFKQLRIWADTMVGTNCDKFAHRLLIQPGAGIGLGIDDPKVKKKPYPKNYDASGTINTGTNIDSSSFQSIIVHKDRGKVPSRQPAPKTDAARKAHHDLSQHGGKTVSHIVQVYSNDDGRTHTISTTNSIEN